MPEPADPVIRAEQREEGWTRLELIVEGRAVSHLGIVELRCGVGLACLRVDGIAGVATEPDCRHRGYARRLLEAALARMRAGDAALSVLYGIPDFYPKFGYATAGPDVVVLLGQLDRAALPAGWSARPAGPADLPAIQRLYDEGTARAVGAVRRRAGGPIWARLAATLAGGADHGDACRVVLDPAGAVEGYAWRARPFWPVRAVLEREYPQALVIGEVMALAPAAADAVLAACRAWAAEEAGTAPAREVALSFPPEGPLAAAAARQASRFVASWRPAAGFMARTLDMGRLLRSLQPELGARLRTLPSPPAGALRLRGELGEATLLAGPDGVAVVDAAAGAVEVVLPQAELARLALGAFPPADVLDRLPRPPTGTARRLLEALFPQRHPYLHLPDRI